MTHANRPIILWLYSGCILIFAMVVIGGITRLTGSGLSITEWNVVTGTIPPTDEIHWQEEFKKYQQSPQYQKINSSFDLAQFKTIYWWEYIHRLLGRLIGLVFIIPFVYFLKKKMIDKKLLPKLVLILFLGAFQGFLGWYMVKSGLVDIPYVSHYRLAIHLITAFITFGYTYWVILDLTFETISIENNSIKRATQLTRILLSLIVIQIIYGGFVAGLHGGKAYNTWPKMGDEWVATSVSMAFEKQGFMSLLDNMPTVQFIHRTLAIVIFCLMLFMWLKRNKVSWSLNPDQKNAIWLSMLIVLLQVILGIFTLLFMVPFWFGVLHQIGAFFLFAVMILQYYKLVHRQSFLV